MSDGDNIQQLDVLKYAIENGIINLCDVQEEIMKKKNKEYLNMHNHSSWYDEKRKCWKTYFDDDTTDRGVVLTQRKSKEKLEEFIIQYYKDKENDPIIRDMFEMWISRKKNNNEIKPQSISKYRRDYKRFFEGTDFEKEKVSSITEDYLDEFIRGNICKYELTNKAYNGLRLLIMGMFKMAKLKKFTSISITTFFKDIDLPSSMFKRVHRDKTKEVFSEDEIPRIKKYLDESDNPNDWGVYLCFETGMRIGELSALKISDFGKHAVHVQRTEVRYDDDNGKCICEVQEMTKSNAGNRHIILTKKAKELYQRLVNINPNREYLFEFKGNRVRNERFNKRLKKACNKLNISKRTAHKIRKTYGTTLLDNNVPESLVTEMIGHSDISTTKKFYYIENLNEEKRIKAIQEALS